jgi:hypothetical protein
MNMAEREQRAHPADAGPAPGMGVVVAGQLRRRGAERSERQDLRERADGGCEEHRAQPGLGGEVGPGDRADHPAGGQGHPHAGDHAVVGGVGRAASSSWIAANS